VDEVSTVVAGFDADAAAVGLSRDGALMDLAEGSAMAKARAQSMGQVLARHDRLSAHLHAVRGGAVLSGVQYVDPDLARATWADYAPAVPVTVAGVGFGAAGFLLGYGVIALLWAGVLRLRRREVVEV